MVNVAFMLRDAATAYAGKSALVERERTTSYTQLAERAGAIAQALMAAGVAPTDRVAILLERGADAAAAFFGVAAAGGVAVNVNETLRPRQIEYILSHAQARVLISSNDMIARLPRALETSVRVIDVADIDSSAPLDPVPRIGKDPVKIIYTSGSTGMPKGVAISHDNLWAGMRSVVSYVEITRDDRIASLLPFSFDYGFNQLLCCVGTGATLIVERSPLPQQIVTALRANDVTVLPGLPPLWLQLLRVPEFREEPLRALRAMTNTGGRLPTSAVRELRAAHPNARLFLMYGLTEAFRATYLPPEQVDRHPDSIGHAIPGSEILVLREDGTHCEPGEVGELVQRGATVAIGYWDNKEATDRVFRVNPTRPAGMPDSERVVYSGDLVRRDDEGFLYYVGRRDRMIKTLGFRVSPDEVLETLYASGEVREGIIGAEEDEHRGERIVAYVVLTPNGSADRLREFCKTELPRYMQPGRIDVVEAIPRTHTGKHDLETLRSASKASLQK